MLFVHAAGCLNLQLNATATYAASNWQLANVLLLESTHSEL